MEEANYKVKYWGRSVEISKANSTTLVYRIPYQNLQKGESRFSLDNKFIVYILVGENENKNDKRKDVVYVGKSKDGLKNRPTAHEGKCKSWRFCYVLTQFKERTFFNDGTIQFIEDEISKIVSKVGRFHNVTQKTTPGTANVYDEGCSQEYIKEIKNMLEVLGLDLITNESEKSDSDAIETNEGDVNSIPNGIYTLKRKIKRAGNKLFVATMKVCDGSFILQKGSMVCSEDGIGMWDDIIEKRKNEPVIEGILQKEVVFDSPSGAGAFVIGASCNGLTNWKNADGIEIKKLMSNGKK